MEHVAAALITLPAGKLLRTLAPSCKPEGSVAVNLAALLKEAPQAAVISAAAADTDANNDQQHEQQQQQQDADKAGKQCLELSNEQVLCLLKLLCCQQLNPKMLATKLAQHASKQQQSCSPCSTMQQPGNSTTDAAAGEAAAAAARQGAADDHQQQHSAAPATAPAATTEQAAAAAAAADLPVGGLPLASLDLSGQPLGLAGWQLLLQMMRRTNCLQRLVVSGCSIEAAGAGEVLVVRCIQHTLDALHSYITDH
jgi:hypothetical protein